MRPLLCLLIYFNERLNFWRHVATYLGYQILLYTQQFESPFDQKDRPKGVSKRSQDLIQRTSPPIYVEFYLYPTVGTVLIHSIKPEMTE